MLLRWGLGDYAMCLVQPSVDFSIQSFCQRREEKVEAWPAWLLAMGMREGPAGVADREGVGRGPAGVAARDRERGGPVGVAAHGTEGRDLAGVATAGMEGFRCRRCCSWRGRGEV